MKRYDVKQGSEEWRRLRAGIPTASNFDRILTAAKLEPSKSREGYLDELVAEFILGMPLDDVTTALMDRGSRGEKDARSYYELLNDVEAQIVGFGTTDDGLIGASPDALVGTEGMLEIKFPKPSTHVAYMFAATEEKPSVDRAYWLQIQGLLFVFERQWCDALSYCPGLPHALIRVERHEPTQEALRLHLADFCRDLQVKRNAAIENGWLTRAEDVREVDWLGITDEDVTEYLAGLQRGARA